MRPHLASLLDDFARHHRDVAVVAHRGNRRYGTTYGQLRDLAGRVSAELTQRGVVPGDRIVLWGANSAEWIACLFGCLLRGAIAVPLDAAGKSEFAARVITDVAPKLIFGDAGLLGSLAPSLAADIPCLVFADLPAQLTRQRLFTVSDTVTENTPFQIVFTSGTMSEPRGIVHTHRNVLASLAPIENEMRKHLRYERWVHPLRFLHTLPLSHVFGQFMGLWIPGLLGAELHFADVLEASRSVDLIRRERISVLIAVPRVLQLLRAHLLGRLATLGDEVADAGGLGIVRRWWRFRRVHRRLGWKFWALISGGATLPAEVETFWNRIGYALIQGYGMTETSALVTLNHPFKIKQGTIGKPLAGREVRLTAEGEILVRGPMLADATWEDGAMRPREDDWLATGDLAEQSATGELRFLGRKGDAIVTASGLNIHPADLERALDAQPGVRACAVVACDAASGPEAVAVVMFSGSDTELQAAVVAANRTLAEFQHIRRVLRWPELAFPYTSTGKLMRRQVAEWGCATLAGRARPSSPPSDTLLHMICEVTGESAPEPACNDDVGGESPGSGSQHPDSETLRLSEDLHLDSLGRVQLQTLIEQRLSVELDDDAISGVATVGELRGLLGEGSVAPFRTEAVTQSAGAVSQPSAAPSRVAIRAQDTSEHVYPRWPWAWPIQIIRRAFVEFIVRPLVSILAAPEVVRDLDKYPKGPLLLISNHVTAYDGALVLYALPARLRGRVAAAMSGEMLLDLRGGRNQRTRLLNLLAPVEYALLTALFNVFPLPRARGFRRSFGHAGEAMDRGYSVLIFPEGTRTRDGRMHAFRPGIGLLAKDSAVPILPVALVGLGALRVTGRGWLRSGKLTIRVGQPILPNPDEGPNELTERLEGALRKLLASPH